MIKNEPVIKAHHWQLSPALIRQVSMSFFTGDLFEETDYGQGDDAYHQADDKLSQDGGQRVHQVVYEVDIVNEYAAAYQ